jgi:tyrosine-protein kinase Etk/Wzc
MVMPDSVQTRHETTMRDFLNVVFRWGYLILAVFLLTTFTIVFLRMSKPVTYVSSARLLVERGERSSVFTPNPRYLDWSEDMSSQLEVILSETVFKEARRMFGDSLAARGLEGTRRFNGGSVRADVAGESNVIVIGYSGLDPVECELGCAAVTEAYIEYYKKATAPPQVDDFFDSEIDLALAELTEWRQKKSDFLNRQEYVGVREESSHQMYKLSRIEASLADVASELSAQGSRLEKLRDLIGLSSDELEQRFTAAATESPVQSRTFADIKSELQRLKTKREELLTLYTGKHPDVMAVDAQLADIRVQLKQEVENAYELGVAQYDEISAKHESLLREKRQTESDMSVLPDKERELERIESNIRANEEKYQLLLEKQHEAQIAIATSGVFEITVLNPPGRATARRTSDYVRLAVGPILSLVVALGLAFFFESMDHSLKNTAEVEQYLRTAVLATVSETRRKKKR